MILWVKMFVLINNYKFNEFVQWLKLKKIEFVVLFS